MPGRTGGSGGSSAPSTGLNVLTQEFHAVGYGAVANAITRGDGAMTTGTSVLTSAGATFTAADVGKTVVVCNAKGAGTHLYGTISAYTNATTVTLSTGCTNTVSASPFTYGTDDTTAIQAAVTAAVAVHGTVILPSTPSVITAAIAVSGACDIRGSSVTPLFGLNTVTGATTGDLSAQTLPITAPFLDGSVVAVCAASVNAFTINASGSAVHFRDLGVYFAGQFTSTGHGFQITATALGGAATGYNNGIQNSRWNNLAVFGHDGSHYAYNILNTLELTGSLWSSFGGGGVKMEANSSISFYGANSIHHLHVALVTGPAYGVLAAGTNGSLISNIPITDYVCINATPYVGTRYAAWGGGLSIVGNSFDFTGTASQFAFYSADVETGTPNMPSNCYVSPDSYWPTINLNGDAAPFMFKREKRRLNADATVSLDTAETAGSLFWLLNDVPEGASWGISTDGTRRLHAPGTLKATGGSPTVTPGAGLGTTPPPVVIAGTDLAGQAIFGSGTSPAAGAVAAFVFAKTQASAPTPVLESLNSATQALGLYVSATSTTGFTVSAASAPTASQAVTVYKFGYHIIDAGGAPSPPLVYDSFDKPDSNTTVGSPQIGSAPTAVLGTWGISSNQAYVVSGAGDNLLTYNPGSADATISVTLAVVANPGVGIAFRASDGTHFGYVLHGGAVWTNNGGAFTQLGTTSSPFAGGDTMTVVLSGTSIIVKKNGVQVGSFTSSFNQSVTKHGFYSANATVSRWDNLQIS